MNKNENKNIIPANKRSKDESLAKICLHVVDHLDALIGFWDDKGICRFANRSLKKLFGQSHDQIIGNTYFKELFQNNYPAMLPYINKVLEGKKQVFDMEMSFENTNPIYYIITFQPHKIKGKTTGFFSHMANINKVIQRDSFLLDSEKTKGRKILRSVIETQENERELIAVELRDKINHSLAYSKMMLETAISANGNNSLLTKISKSIHITIDELNRISSDLTPSIISMIGFQSGINEYINNFKKRYPLKITFNCMDDTIEQLSVNDKISVFRILQDYLLIIASNTSSKKIKIEINRSGTTLILKMRTDNIKFSLPEQEKEFLDIEHRLEYYNGSWKHFIKKDKNVFQIELEIAVMQ